MSNNISFNQKPNTNISDAKPEQSEEISLELEFIPLRDLIKLESDGKAQHTREWRATHNPSNSNS